MSEPEISFCQHLEVYRQRPTVAAPGLESKGILLLGHAMFNRMDYLLKPEGRSLADFFCTNGYEVLAFNLSGYGRSRKTKNTTDFDQYVADYRLIISTLRSENRKIVAYIGHSVGSVVGISALCLEEMFDVKSILFCPAIWTFSTPAITRNSMRQGAELALARAWTSFADLPVQLLKMGNTPPPAPYIKQFTSWVKSRKVLNNTGQINYPDLWKNMKSVHVISGSRDAYMAPTENIDWILKHLDTDRKHERVSRSSKFGFDGGHFDILYGAQAAARVWPICLEFVEGAGSV